MTSRSAPHQSGGAWHAPATSSRRSRLPDEVYGARAAGALGAGELDEAAGALAPVSGRYLAGFCLRLAIVTPGVSVRLAWSVVRRRLGAPP